MKNDDVGQLLIVRRLCHQRCASSCVYQKRKGLHNELLKQRPHWSIQKKDVQFEQIDLGEKVPFDIALPLPARDPGNPESQEGVKLFWEKFQCLCCGRCCYTPGAGLYLEKEDFERIAVRLGSKKKLKSLCTYDEDLKA